MGICGCCKNRNHSDQQTISNIVTSEEFSHVFVLVNTKSGSGVGSRLLTSFRELLSQPQVVNLPNFSKEALQAWCNSLNKPAVVVAAGGDGTVASTLNIINKLKVKMEPVVGVIPLGTGNDMSRVLGWGYGYSPDSCAAPQILANIQQAQSVKLDRWQIDISPHSRLHQDRRVFMYNYFSVGVDAKVALDFHQTRQMLGINCCYLNKLLYTNFGLKQSMLGRYADLQMQLEVYLDGERKYLPSIESVVILNIPSWAAGVDLWALLRQEQPELPEQSFSDGKLEVVALLSVGHIAELYTGRSAPLYVGQASSVKIILKNKVAIQVDGEPWEQRAGEINISVVNQASVLKLAELGTLQVLPQATLLQ